jgi:hypothetical protein
MNAAVRTAISAKEAVKIAERAMDLADAQCKLFGEMVSEYGGS